MSTSERKPLPFWATFTAGAIAGVSEILCFYPLDVVKTRAQLATGAQSAGLVQSFKTIIAEEGVGRLYRGLAPPLLLGAPKRAVKFAANDFWSQTFKKAFNRKELDQSLSILTGMSAGATESFVVVPFELVKIRLQDKTSTHAGPMAVIRHIVATNGVLGLYSGMEATFWRHVWWNAGFFGAIYQVRSLLPKAKNPKEQMVNNLISGTVGGFIGTVINTPFDVFKSRYQSAPAVPVGGKSVPKYNWTYPGLVTIAREEGIRALWKGFVPKVLRLAPGGGVLLLVVELVSGSFRKMLGPPYI